MGDTQVSQTNLLALPGPGAELGAYRILELLGTGGMGQVFLAEHKRLGRRVALKLLLPQFASNPEVIGRFFHEAKAVNEINHAHIVEIVDFVEEPGGYNYFIMELLDGRDLASTREHDGPFTIARTLRVGRQIAAALSATHAKGIIHRDLKPENIFLVQRENQPDFVKILDFGIAKLSASEPITEKPKTRAGIILGTPEFMSPEQAGGQTLDSRSDLYALGIILYWMLSDQPPFRGDSLGEILVKQLTEPPPPLERFSASGESIPRELRRVVERLLEREPGKRPQSAQDLLDALPASALEGGTIAPPRRPSLVVPGLSLGAALVLAALLAFFLNHKGTSATAPAELAAPAPTLPALPALPPPPAEVPPTPPPAPTAAAARAASPKTPEALGASDAVPEDAAEAVGAKSEDQKPRPKAKAKAQAAPEDNSGMINAFDN